VPETAVNEDRDPRPGEDDIRPNGPGTVDRNRQINPESQAPPMKRGADELLGLGVAAPVRLHDPPPRRGDAIPTWGASASAEFHGILPLPMKGLQVHEPQLRPDDNGVAPERDRADSQFLRRTDRPKLELGAELEIVDLFAGCGGLTLGAIEGASRAGRPAGLALAVDSNPDPLEVLQRTLQAPDRCFAVADLTHTLGCVARAPTAAEHDVFGGIAEGSLLLAGPPCQGHSALNNHTRHDDPRNDLYLAVGRVARILKPAAVIVENVRGVGRDRRAALERCTSVLEELGYHVTARPLDLSRVGVPQRRLRHLLVATRNRPFRWELPEVGERDLQWAISDLLEREGATPFDTPATPSPVNLERMRWLIEHDEFDLPNDRRPPCHQSDHSYRSMYGRLRWDAPAQTITSGFGSMGQGRYVHPSRPRTLTPHEAARLQFLPDYVAFDGVEHRTKLAEMIGNAVPPLVGAVLVEALSAQRLL
jgi:DNA (cytosine-5)-methyltransferase 1